MLRIALVSLVLAARLSAATPDLAAMAPAYLADMPRLKELRAQANARAAVGVYADYGVWSGSARALFDALRAGGAPVRVLDRADFTANGLAGVKLLILPGGLAPLEWQSMGAKGLGVLEEWVRRGGHLVGLCAGAYLVSREVRYDGRTYPYPLGLFDGVAEGPVAGLAAYPAVGAVRLGITEAGRSRGLEELGLRDLGYGGGPRFIGGSGVTVLARYPDWSAAVIVRAHGAGQVLLSGAHVELAPGKDPWNAAPHPQAAALLRALLSAITRQSATARSRWSGTACR